MKLFICLFIWLKWQYPSEEDMIEWAKRESEREEEQRLARLNQQEQEDLELAIALSKSEISEAWRILLSFGQPHSIPRILEMSDPDLTVISP